MTGIFFAKYKRLIGGALLAALLAGLFVVPVNAETTAEKLEKAKQERATAADGLLDTQGKLQHLQADKSALQEVLTGLNDDLIGVSQKLSSIEGQLSEKEAQIEKMEEEIQALEEEIDTLGDEIAETEDEISEQYDLMKRRIRYIYEHGENKYLDIFFGARSFKELLNFSEYIAKSTDYDKKLLNSLKEKKESIEEKKSKVEADKAEIVEKKESQEEEKSDIVELKDDAASEQNKVMGLVHKTASGINEYSGQIAKAEADAKAYEAQFVQKTAEVSALEAELERERQLAELSRQLAKKNLGQINVAEGERELLACLIYCEAGAEPYTGQVAVGAVVMNRCMSGAFPDTITGVIYQSGQFAPVASGRLAARLAQGANDSCYRAADAALSGENPIGDRLFFRTIIPEIKGKIIGGHVFYNP